MSGSFFGLDKWAKLAATVKQNGGLRNSLRMLYRTDDLKDGRLVGVDKNGNKYYENNRYFYGRNRWVVYNEKYHLEYDGSMIPAEWFGWMHYKTDKLPTEAGHVTHKWIAPHVDNRSGTAEAYMPYSTTKPKIESWKPGSSSQRK